MTDEFEPLSPGARDIMEFLHHCRDRGIYQISKADLMRAMKVDEEEINPEDEENFISLTDKGIGERLQ